MPEGERKNYPLELIRQCLTEAKAAIDAGSSGWARRIIEKHQIPKGTLLSWMRRYDGNPANAPAQAIPGDAIPAANKGMRRKYSREFIDAAMKKYQMRGDKSAAVIAREIGVNVSILRRWASRGAGKLDAPKTQSRPLPAPVGKRIIRTEKTAELNPDGAQIKTLIPVHRYIQLLELENENLREKLRMAS